MTVGERISQIRKERGMTQEELGEKCGASKQTVYKYEKNIITNIPLESVSKIAMALHTTPGFLMGWEKKSPPSKTDSGQMPEGYEDLTPENRGLVDALIAQLSKAQRESQPVSGHARTD